MALSDEMVAASNYALSMGAIQKGHEFVQLLFLMEQLHPKIIVEIGSDRGGTLHGFRSLFPEARLISIDLPKGPYSTGNDLNAPEGTTVIAADSHLGSTWWQLGKELHGQFIDALFIDGDHTYEGVRDDNTMYSAFVRPGGIVIFHDIVEHPDKTVGVHRLWNELEGEKYEFIEEPLDWGGIGVLVVG